MRALFLRVYTALFGVLVVGLALVWALGTGDAAVQNGPLLRVAGFPSAAAQALSGVTAPGEQDERLETLSRRFGHPVRLLPAPAVAASLSPGEQAALQRGEPVTVSGPRGGKVLVPLGAQPFVVALGPIPTEVSIGPLPFVLLAMLIALAGLATVLLRPLERELSALGTVAERLGAGELDVRSELPADAFTAELAAALDDMAARIEALIHSRQELLNAVSHELRGPLQRLRFAVELLEEDGNAAEVEAIQRDIEELDALVEELLAWSRLGAGTDLRPSPVQVGPLVERIVAEARRLRPIRVEVDCTAASEAWLDERLFARVVTNLVGNAVRYADAQVRVTARGGGAALVVQVDDDGPGVPVRDRERVFEPFVRLDEARARDTGGVGLGLAIAARIAEAHGAGLAVDDSPLGGASFRWAGALDPPRHAETGYGPGAPPEEGR